MPTVNVIDRTGYPFVITPLIVAGLLFAAGFTVMSGLALVLSFVLLAFFRDPHRMLPTDLSSDAVISPADGRVLFAGPGQKSVCPPGEWGQISIFLSPLDVHVNRVPVNGKVIDVGYQPGSFFPAYNARSAVDNERTEITVNHEGQLIVFRQIVGVLARRVVCRIRPGMTVAQGERFGVMKFGSRMDVFIPATAVILVEEGAKVRSGESVIAMLTSNSSKPISNTSIDNA